MANNKIKYYPVDNGDTSLITLKDNTTILIDCNFRKEEKNSDGNNVYPVKKDLLDSIRKRKHYKSIDLFVLTHPDQDHCRGFEKNFYQGDPDDYGKSNRDNEEIIIDEIWVTSMLFTWSVCSDANAIRSEVNRRKRLTGNDKNKRGNRLRLVGYDEDRNLQDVIQYVPGYEINSINDVTYDTFSIFIHAPFKKNLIKGKAIKDRNSASIVFQARFKDKNTDIDHSSYAIFGGDADHNNWKHIIKITERHNKGKYLRWDLLLAPHHCSWSYFNDTPYSNKENQTPKDHSIKLLKDYRENGGSVICSSKKVIEAKRNPPHKAAKDQYLKYLDSEKDFFELAIIPKEKSPEPIEFIMTNKGPQKSTEKAKLAITSAGGAGATGTVVKQG